MRRHLLEQAVVMLLVGFGVTISLPLEAQDIETLARIRGLELPLGYYERVREDPNAFTLQMVFSEPAQKAVQQVGRRDEQLSQ